MLLSNYWGVLHLCCVKLNRDKITIFRVKVTLGMSLEVVTGLHL